MKIKFSIKLAFATIEIEVIVGDNLALNLNVKPEV